MNCNLIAEDQVEASRPPAATIRAPSLPHFLSRSPPRRGSDQCCCAWNHAVHPPHPTPLPRPTQQRHGMIKPPPPPPQQHQRYTQRGRCIGDGSRRRRRRECCGAQRQGHHAQRKRAGGAWRGVGDAGTHRWRRGCAWCRLTPLTPLTPLHVPLVCVVPTHTPHTPARPSCTPLLHADAYASCTPLLHTRVRLAPTQSPSLHTVTDRLGNAAQ
eukprot:352958-Chlamydomonas_euryale.AAC.1